MLQHIRPALTMLLLFTVLTGIAYPLALTGVSQTLLPSQANGSLVTEKGVVIGSALIGQHFASDRYFKARPSATSAPDPKDASKTIDAPYNAANSAGSNLGPLSQKLADRVKGDIATLRSAGVSRLVPADAITASASGLDPHITPENALTQIPGVARARNLPEARLRELIRSQTEGRLFGLLGEPRVNVLMLNLALDKISS